MLYGGLRLRDTESIQANTNSQVLWERRACVNRGRFFSTTNGLGIYTRLGGSMKKLPNSLHAHARRLRDRFVSRALSVKCSVERPLHALTDGCQVQH